MDVQEKIGGAGRNRTADKGSSLLSTASSTPYPCCSACVLACSGYVGNESCNASCNAKCRARSPLVRHLHLGLGDANKTGVGVAFCATMRHDLPLLCCILRTMPRYPFAEWTAEQVRLTVFPLPGAA